MPGKIPTAKSRPGDTVFFPSKNKDDMSSSEDESVPVLLRNPDGTMAEGVPPGYKEKTVLPTGSAAARMPYGYFSDGLMGELDAAALQDELNFLCQRHQQIFATLMLMQFIVESVFFVLCIVNAELSIQEAHYIYPSANMKMLWWVFWMIFGVESAYAVTYYSLALMAVQYQKPRHYRWFSHCCVLGIVSQLVLAYVNKFNLLIFFLRMLGYLYAKFLKSLVLNMSLMPSPVGALPEP